MLPLRNLGTMIGKLAMVLGTSRLWLSQARHLQVALLPDTSRFTATRSEFNQ